MPGVQSSLLYPGKPPSIPVKISTNGGTVLLILPSEPISGRCRFRCGAVRIVADEIENRFYRSERRRCTRSDVREPGSTYLRDAGGAGVEVVSPYWQMEI